jgi:hypothetical protein
VVIPALDEERSLPLVLGDLPPVGWVFVVDNGSTDNTAQVAESAGAQVISEPRRGYGSACLAGIAQARAAGAEIIVILDGDHADEPALIDRLLQPILDGAADLVLSDRTQLAEPDALLPHQRHGNRLATALIHLATGHRYADMGPFRAVRTDALARLDMQDRNYGWNVEMQMKAIQRGLRVREVPMPYRTRVGVSKISGTLRGTVAAGSKIIWSVWRYHDGGRRV